VRCILYVSQRPALSALGKCARAQQIKLRPFRLFGAPFWALWTVVLDAKGRQLAHKTVADANLARRPLRWAAGRRAGPRDGEMFVAALFWRRFQLEERAAQLSRPAAKSAVSFRLSLAASGSFGEHGGLMLMSEPVDSCVAQTTGGD